MVGVVAVVVRDQRLLLIQRSALVRAPGMWCFCGGEIEPEETPAQAIVREFQEELGAEVRASHEVWRWNRGDGALLLHWWFCELLTDTLTANPAEVQAFGWFTRSGVLALEGLLPGNRGFLNSDAGQQLNVLP